MDAVHIIYNFTVYTLPIFHLQFFISMGLCYFILSKLKGIYYNVIIMLRYMICQVSGVQCANFITLIIIFFYGITKHYKIHHHFTKILFVFCQRDPWSKTFHKIIIIIIHLRLHSQIYQVYRNEWTATLLHILY